MTLAQALFVFLLQSFAPGNTAFSVEPAPGGRYSSFHGTTVKRETFATGAARYLDFAEVLVEAATEVHAETKTRIFTRDELVALGAGTFIQEGGLREDVMNGRGWAKKADDVGGRGRGPGREACSAQIHPVIAWRFADTTPELRAAAEGGDRKAREAIAQSLIGRDRESLRRCFRTGLRMLVHGAHWCSRGAKGSPADWSAVAVYVSGTSCTTSQGGKTGVRVRLARRIHAALKAKSAKATSAMMPASCERVAFTKPKGWVAVRHTTPAMTTYARTLLGSPLGTEQMRDFAGAPVLARVDMHCDAVRGPHPGVSLYQQESHRSASNAKQPSGQQ